MSSTAVGTLAYWPPEKFSFKVCYDSRSDIWSLGITLLEVLYGNIPYTNIEEDLLTNFMALQRCIQETKSELLITNCLGKYNSWSIRDFISECLQNISTRPTCIALMRTNLYVEYKPKMDPKRVADFIKNYDVNF